MSEKNETEKTLSEVLETLETINRNLCFVCEQIEDLNNKTVSPLAMELINGRNK